VSVDGTVVAEQNSRNGFRWRSRKIALTAGRHDVAIDFVGRPREVEDEFAEREREEFKPEIRVEFEGPGIERQPIEPALMAATPSVAIESPEFPIDAGLAAEGRELFASKGCASCHEVQEAGRRVASGLVAPALASLTRGGCLAQASPGTPNFALDAKQKEMLISYLTTVKNDPQFAALDRPRDIITHSMLTFNCFACHSRDNVWGSKTRATRAFNQISQRGAKRCEFPRRSMV